MGSLTGPQENMGKSRIAKYAKQESGADKRAHAYTRHFLIGATLRLQPTCGALGAETIKGRSRWAHLPVNVGHTSQPANLCVMATVNGLIHGAHR